MEHSCEFTDGDLVKFKSGMIRGVVDSVWQNLSSGEIAVRVLSDSHDARMGFFAPHVLEKIAPKEIK